LGKWELIEQQKNDTVPLKLWGYMFAKLIVNMSKEVNLYHWQNYETLKYFSMMPK
jgi:hypothetical protein